MLAIGVIVAAISALTTMSRRSAFLKGVVAGKGCIMDGLMYFPLKTADTVLEVRVGPNEFVKSEIRLQTIVTA